MANPVARVTEGTIPFLVDGETYQTFYKVFGDFSSTNTPLVVLHGGPGLTHNYLLPISDLAANADIPVIFYDQLGNGRSTHLPEKPPTFWTIDLFITELENILAHFNISNAFDVLGHSWGGVLGAEFEVRRQPAGLRHLVLTDSLAASALWGKSTMQLAQTLSPDVQAGLAAGMAEPVRLWAAMQAFHAVYGCLVVPIPAELQYSFEQVFGEHGDPTVARAPMLKDWTIVERLRRIRVPTFVINGRKDIAQDFVVSPFFEHIPKVKWVTFENSSHTPFWEERERYGKLLAEFLKL